MAERASTKPALPSVVLGLTFLFIGLSFALPIHLIPLAHLRAAAPNWSVEVGNVYAITAWAGWAHFIYAFRGQGLVLKRTVPKSLGTFAFLLVLLIGVLAGARQAIGTVLFGSLVWVYFIDHFLKAERLFDGSSAKSRWGWSAQPLITFGWLTVVLQNVGNVTSYPWILWIASLALGIGVLVIGGWEALARGDVRSPLLSLFFVAEALVWGTISRFGESVFLSGVYVFHIAAGSFFHYLSSYFFALSKAPKGDRWLTYASIIGVNVAVITVGSLVANLPALSFLVPILGIHWFTLWVGVHLFASDLFPMVKRSGAKVVAPGSV